MKTHEFEFRVYYEDTDCMGIVYYANYLHFAERARTEFLRDGGFDKSASHIDNDGDNADNDSHGKNFGKNFVVRRCNIRYLRPAYHDDWLRVETLLDNSKPHALQRSKKLAMIDLQQKIFRGNQLLVTLHVNLALIDKNGKACPLPLVLASYFGLET